MSFIQKVSKMFFDEWETKGVSVPLMYDPVTDKASLTVLFPYVSFWLTVISLVAMHFVPSLWTASFGCGVLWLVSTVLYMIRKLNKATIDFDDKKIELQAEPESQDPGTGSGSVSSDPVQQ